MVVQASTDVFFPYPSHMIVPNDELQAIERLRESNLNLQAYERSKPFGKLTEWEGTDALITASHLAFNLGAPEQSWQLTSRAWHRDKTHPRALFYYAIEIFQRRGPLFALLFTRRFPDFKADDVLTSWWYALQEEIHATLRDFTVAGHWHREAVASCPQEPWVWVARAFSLEQQDRYDEALMSARKGLELAPGRRSTVSAVAHYLTLLGSNEEALDLMSTAIDRVENPWMVKELADLQSELGMHREAYATLQRCFELLPLLEEKAGSWFYGGLSDGAYLVGDTERAIEYAEKASNPFHTKVGENLKKSPADARRVQLDVRFLRQHHVTCAPATLSNIARYWKKRAEHLDLVQQMCYDGTPSYKERIWADSNGWITREFTLNWNDATMLLDREVPLTLATVYPGGGHLQAIIGYDAGRRTLLVRDPYYQRIGEVLAEELIENQKANGPRAMALVPVESKDLLQELGRPLFESEIYDLLYEVESALEVHKRTEAGAALKRLDEQFPDHRLSFAARWAISAYDTNQLGVRFALQKLLEKFPDDVNLRLSDLSVSSEFTGRIERIRMLENYAKADPTDPLIWQMFGYELGLDSKQHKRAFHWLAKAIRKSPVNALNYRLVADILWSQRRFEESAELYRFASSLNDKDEPLAYSYFLAMRYLKREDEAVDILADRVKRFWRQSGLPVRSLYSALRELGRVAEAFAALDESIKLRPDDGELILFAAEARARYGRTTQADELLRAANGKASKPQWLRAAAHVAHLKGELELALSHWKEVLEGDPIATDAHENIAFLIRGTEGAIEAKDHLRNACRKFPRNRSLHVLRLQHLNEEPSEAIAVLRDLIRLDPGDVWSLRELANWYMQVGRLDRALQAAENAVAVDPNDGISQWFRGRVLELQKRYSEAAEAYRTAVSLNADHGFSISSWLGISRSIDDKRKVLDFVWQELNKQVGLGDGLFTYRDEARRAIDRPSLLKNLQEFAAANGRSWFAPSAVIQQLAEMGRTAEAIDMAEEATRRFPLVHNTWLDLSLVYKLGGNVEGEIEALRTAISINPVWSYGVQQLSDAYRRAGRFTSARDVLLDALTRMPFDNFLLGFLADIYWALGERESAIETAKRAVTIEPDYQWAWGAIKRWANEIGNRELPVALARELTEKKPKDARAWVTLAEMLETGAFSQDRLDAAERALKIDPFSPPALAIKAYTLSEARRFDEAIEVARTAMADGYRPEQLRYAEAAIESARGEMRRSLDALIELTETSPGYLPGWLRLADQYRLDDERSHEYRKVALEIVRLEPRGATAFGYLAEACLKLDLKDDAREALEQAVILDPAYEFGVKTLFDLYLDADEMPAAERLVDTIRTSSSTSGLPIAIELAVRKKDQAKTIEYLVQLLRDRNVKSDTLDRVFENVTTLFGKKDKAVLAHVRDVCLSGEANPIAGRYLIDQVWEAEKRSGCEKTLESISGQSSLWAHAASRFMEKLAFNKPGPLRRFIDAHAEKLAEQTESWGSVGYHLTNLDDPDRLANWFKGWENRPDVMPWMLWNYSIVLRRNARSADADAINSAAVNLPYDDSINGHLTTLALNAFKAGDFGTAAAMLSEVNPGAMTSWERFFYDALSEALWANERIEMSDIEAAKALVDSIVDKMIAFDPKRSDRMVRDLVGGVLDRLLSTLGSKWYSFFKKAKLYYYSLG